MKRLLNIIMMTLAAVPAALLAQPTDYKINVQDFNELIVVDGVNVYYHHSVDSTGYACFTCEPTQVSHIIFENKGGLLSIQSDADEAAVKGLPDVHVYSATLTKATNSGDSLLCVVNPAPVSSFKASQIGNGAMKVLNIEAGKIEAGNMTGHGHLSISGKADKAVLKNVGTGPVDAVKLESADIKCYMLGTGNIECSPSGTLRIFGAGTGKVLYHATPQKIQNRSIGVVIVNANQPEESEQTE